MKQILLLAACAAMLASCTSYERAASSGWSYYQETDKALFEPSLDPAAPPPAEDRMIVYNASMGITVKEVQPTLDEIGATAATYGGYVLNSNNHSVTLRIKSEQLDKAMDAFASLGKLDHRSVSGRDVTDQHFDLSIRLENAEKSRTRYLELLAKAESVSEALLVEKELERLNGEIDLLKGKIAQLEHLETYSTLTVRVSEKVKPGPLGYVAIGLYKSVKWLFVRG